jgi:membrane protein implicated in regulation of membrane protease activity
MSLWMIWIIIGIACVIIEIFTPGFFFMSIGMSTILTGLFALVVSNVFIQAIVFIIISFLIFINMKKLSKKIFKTTDKPTNVYALIGKKGMVTKDITKTTRGYVKINGEIWSAISVNEDDIEKDSIVVVRKVEGNKVIVEKLEEEK